MRVKSALILAMAAGVLPAQEAAHLDSRVQLFVESAQPTSLTVFQDPGNINDRPGWMTGVGLRMLGELPGTHGFYYELGYMFDTSSYFKLNGTLPDGTSGNLTGLKLSDSYWSLGAAYLFRPDPNWSLGLHLEARGEYLRLQGYVSSTTALGSGSVSQSNTDVRPWARASADYTFRKIGGDAHPFVGVEGACALQRTTQTAVPTSLSAIDNRTLDALAPKYSGAIYGGIRF